MAINYDIAFFRGDIMRRNRRRILCLTAILLLLVCLFAFFGCNNQIVYEGIIVSKAMGEPLLFSIGQLKMVDPSRDATYFSFVVKAENGDTVKVYVSQEAYESYEVGDWFDVEKNRR